MHILLISADNSKAVKVGGKHIHQELLERGWTESGHKVTTIYPDPGSFPILRKLHNRSRVILGEPKSKIYIDHVNRFINDLQKQLNEYINDGNQFDIISSQDPISGCAAGRLLKEKNINIPIVNTLHGYLSLETINYGYFEDNDKTYVLDFTKSMEKESAEYSTSLVAVDSRIKDYLSNDLRTDKKVNVVFNAIDNQRFHPVDNQKQQALKKELGFNPNKTIILIARRMVKKNGIIYGLKAAERIVKTLKLDDVQFCIAGNGKERKNLESYVKENKLEHYVNFIGQVSHDEIDKFYKMTDFLLMPSTKSDDVEEATSLSMLEGLVCGKVVIATAIGGMKEVIDSGKNGLLVEDRDYTQMAEYINKYAHDNESYKKIAEIAYEYAMTHHGYMSHSQQFIEIFHNAII